MPANRQRDGKQTDRHADRSTSHPYRGEVKLHALTKQICQS